MKMEKQVKKIEGERKLIRLGLEEMKSLMFMEERRKKIKEQEMVQF